MPRIEIPSFAEKSNLIDWLITNKSALIAQKKAEKKDADACSAIISYLVQGPNKSTEVETKADASISPISPEAVQLKVRSIINTTKYFDSHGDVHIDQLWNKSLKENKDLYLVQEHNFSFGGIISDNVKAFTKQISWHELGYNYEGNTQALVFDSIIDKEGSPKLPGGQTMFDMYRTNKVKNHSVGMRYVNIDLAVNDSRYEKEFAIWNKYIDTIANKEDALDNGYFWAVTAAKVIEGSAVVKGSNKITPTQSVTQTKMEQGNTIPVQPDYTTAIKEALKGYNPSKYIKN